MAAIAERERDPVAMLLRRNSAQDDEQQRAADRREAADRRSSEEQTLMELQRRPTGFGVTSQKMVRVTPKLTVEGLGEIQADSSLVVLFSRVRRGAEPTSTKTIHGNGFGMTEFDEENFARQ